MQGDRLLGLLLGACVLGAVSILFRAERETGALDGNANRAADWDESRCTALTHEGKRCSRPAEPGSDRCWQHGG